MKSARNSYLGEVKVHSKLKVGIPFPGLSNDEICSELILNRFWQSTFRGKRSQIFDVYSNYEILDIAVVSPQDFGFTDNSSRLSVIEFIDYVILNYPEFGLLKPEAFFRIGRNYSIDFDEIHSLAIRKGVEMHRRDKYTKRFSEKWMLGGFHLLGRDDNKYPGRVYPIKLSMPDIDRWVTFIDDKWIFRYIDPDKVISAEDDLTEYNNMSFEEWMDDGMAIIDDISPWVFNNIPNIDK